MEAAAATTRRRQSVSLVAPRARAPRGGREIATGREEEWKERASERDEARRGAQRGESPVWSKGMDVERHGGQQGSGERRRTRDAERKE